MISNSNRFHGRGSLSDVYRRGKMVRGPLFAIRALPTNRRSYRVAVVVSRKVHKSAVARNRIRRRLYALLRGLMSETTQPIDIVVTVFQPELLSEPQDNLSRQLKKQLTDSGALPKRAA